MPNICCRIFKEQIDLINQLPEEDRAKVLYYAINNAFNQFENQNENQNENQFDNQIANQNHLYLYLLSGISEYVLKLLCKNIVCKEFSNNYGGKRNGAGRHKLGKISITSLQHNNNISNTHVIDAESERESEKEKEEESKNKINKNINNILNNNLYINKIYIDDNFSIPVDDFFNQYRKELGNEIINQVENWIKTTQKGKYIDKQFVCKQFINFAKRQNKPLIRA